jgi:DNA-binding MarR family transcriptional regulator
MRTKRTPAGPGGPRYDALLQLLSTADTIWSASRVFFEQWNLSPSQFNVLNLLHQHPEGLSQTELSTELVVHRSNVTGLVDRLEKRALLKRNEVAEDRRAYRVVLTRTGADLLREILPRYYTAAERAWDSLSARRAAEVITDLQQLSRNAQRISRETNHGLKA